MGVATSQAMSNEDSNLLLEDLLRNCAYQEWSALAISQILNLYKSRSSSQSNIKHVIITFANHFDQMKNIVSKKGWFPVIDFVENATKSPENWNVKQN